MSSVIWYLYEFARKSWVEKFAGAKTDPEIAITPSRFRDFPEVEKELCIACGACVAACPSPGAIKLVRDEDVIDKEGITYPVINMKSCIRCGFCAEVCPTDPKTLRTGENHLIMEEFTLLPTEKIFVIDDYLCIRCKKCIEACKLGVITQEDKKIWIDPLRCISCGDCIAACPVKGSIKEIFVSNIEEQKQIISLLIKTLEDRIETEFERIKERDYEKIIKLELPLTDFMKKAHEILPNNEIIKKTIEKITDRLRMNIITWDEELCNGCRLCVDECPTGALSYDKNKGIVVRDPKKCLRCTICYQTCPFGVVGLYAARFLLKDDTILITLKLHEYP